METKKILIVGDSFSSPQLAGKNGWPNLLEKQFVITNLSQPGIGEYKILQKLKTQNLSQFDLVIISHTSENRLHCESNPLYPQSHLYHSSDIIFADAESKKDQLSIANTIVDYFKIIFDPEYYRFIHYSCCQEIDKLTSATSVIHMTNFQWNHLYPFKNLLNFYEVWRRYPGEEVHYSYEGNQIVFNTLLEKINKIS
jgi:hypothetical protein